VASISVSNISMSFGGTQVLHNLSFNVSDGEAVVLLGPSGCGKTTLLKLMAGFLKPDIGEIMTDGNVLSDAYHVIPPDRRKMSMVFQSYAIWPHKTVFENVSYGLQVQKKSKEEIRRRVYDALSVVQLEKLADRYSTELSGGQQQRVSLARAIVVEPTILLLDEPLSNLDANLRVEMREELSEIHRRLGLTFVYVTHDQSEAMVLGDRILLLNQGHLIQEGPPTALYEEPRTSFAATFIGTSNVFLGKRKGIANGMIEVETNFGSVQVGRQTDNSPENLTDMTFCIRPEWIELLASDSSSDVTNVFSAKVLKRVYYGRHIHYVLDLAGHELNLETPFDIKVEVGADVRVRLPENRCVCLQSDAFQADTKTALENAA
jgi:iron(III) transport system ATP-binding protein